MPIDFETTLRNYADLTVAVGLNLQPDQRLLIIGPVANGTVASTGRALPGDAGLVFQGPTDEFVTYDGQFLYALNAAVPSIGIFRINNDGTLSRVGSGDYTTSPAALAAGSAGIVAR